MNPPPRSIIPLLWLKGRDEETEEVIRNEIRAMDLGGSRGFVIESRPHKDYLGEGWWRDLAICIDEAQRLGMEIWIFDEEYYPSGIAGGKVIECNPEQYRMRVMVHYQEFHDVENGPYQVKKTAGTWKHKAVQPSGVEDWETMLCVTARAVKDGGVKSELMVLEEGQIWHPGGKIRKAQWVIDYVGIVPSWSGRMYDQMVDYLNPEVTDVFIQLTYESTKQRFGDEFGHVIKGFFGDETSFENFGSYDVLFGKETPSMPYTRNLIQEFKTRKGYDPTERLYLLWVAEPLWDAELRYDYMDVMTNLFAEHFFGRCQKWCHDNGVQFIGHIIEDNQAHAHHGYGVGHFFKASKHFDMGGYDLVLRQMVPGYKKEELLTENWDTDFFAWTIAVLARSSAHLELGTDRVMCENFGAYGWTLGLRDMKWMIDWQTVRGTNVHVPHAFSMEFPDEDCPPHFYAQGHNPQWPYYPIWARYTNRCAMMLQDGKHKAPVAVLYTAESHWVGDKLSMDEVSRTLAEGQIDFDFISMDILLNQENCNFEEGALHVANEIFEGIIVPRISRMSGLIAERLLIYVESGGKVLFVDQVPKEDLTGRSIANLSERLQSMTRTLSLEDLPKSCQLLGMKDVFCESICRHLRYYRVVRKEWDQYFVTNESLDEKISDWIHLKTIHAGVPELWNPLNGTISEAPLYSKTDDGWSVFIQLEPFESVFVIFQEKKKGIFHGSGNAVGLSLDRLSNAITKRDQDGSVQLFERNDAKCLELSGSWTIEIQETNKDEGTSSEIQLGDWTADSRWTDYSGTVVYKTSFDMPVSSFTHWFLNLGEIGEIAEVSLNGKSIGCSICPPYQYMFMEILLQKHNELVISVTNTLGNQVHDRFRAQHHISSGLIGPVMLVPLIMTEL